MCECDNVVVHQVEMEVKKIFQHHYGLEQWAGWLDEVTTHLLQEHIGSPDFARAARQLILKWTFYRSVLADFSRNSFSSSRFSSLSSKHLWIFDLHGAIYILIFFGLNLFYFLVS